MFWSYNAMEYAIKNGLQNARLLMVEWRLKWRDQRTWEK